MQNSSFVEGVAIIGKYVQKKNLEFALNMTNFGLEVTIV